MNKIIEEFVLVLLRCVCILGCCILLGCDANLNQSRLREIAQASIAEQRLMNPHEWVTVWKDIGTKEFTPIQEYLHLPIEVQNQALLALQHTLRADSKKPQLKRFKEKPFVQGIEHIFTDKPIYFLAYAEIADHAILRGEAIIGSYMYRNIPDDKEVFQSLPSEKVMLVHFYKEEYKKTLPLATEIMLDSEATRNAKELARIVRLISQVKIGQSGTCDEIQATSLDDFETASLRKRLEKLKADCAESAGQP